MKKVILTISALMISAMISTGAFATVPDLIPVQGVLADSADLPIDALTDMTFTLYDASTAGTTLWTDTFVDVDVVEGFFTVYLGSDTALDFGSLISNSEIWVGITVESDPEMDRFQLATVPFAIEAQVSQMVGTLTETDINNNYAPISHTHAWGDLTGVPAGLADGDDNTNAATICAAGEFLNGDGTCDAVVVDTNTNAGTICAAGEFLNGDGSCDAVVVDTNTNAATMCAAGQFLNGDGTCDAVVVDTNTNAGTICAAGQFLNGDGTCDAVPIANTGSVSIGSRTLSSGGYYFGSSSSYTPSGNKTCFVSCTLRGWESGVTLSSGYGNLAAAISTNGTTGTAGVEITYMGPATSTGADGRSGGIATSRFNLNSGTAYWFGCRSPNTSGPYTGLNVTAFATYICMAR